jgi:hypothetical protein
VSKIEQPPLSLNVLSSNGLSRRTVKTISITLEPKQIFDLIMKKQGDYIFPLKEKYTCRDRAGMALSFLTVGRVTEIFGGDKMRRVYVAGLYPDIRDKRNWVEEKIGKHYGLQTENLEFTDDFLLIKQMGVVKRSHKVIAKYGLQSTMRGQLRFPLKTGLYTNLFYDQLVPFTWLVKEYIQKYAPSTGKLFKYQDCWAWHLIRYYTGMFPNWFRAQADRFYGYYITKDSIKHSKFVGRQKPESSAAYIRYTDTSDLKDETMAMDFKWIAPSISAIQERLN